MSKHNEQLCSKCKTGLDSYLLDNRSPFCPNIEHHNGKECPFFKELDNAVDELNKN